MTDHHPDLTGPASADPASAGPASAGPVPIRVVVVDDHALIRAGIAALIDSLPDLVLVGEAADGRAALEVVAESRPDIVLMDVDMAGLDGISATRLLRAQDPKVAVLVLTMIDDDESLAAAVEAGAAGYVLKASTGSLPHAIRTVAAGGSAFGPDLASRLLARRAPTDDPAALFPQLTEREREILALLADGATNPTIARGLGISPRTVANHVSAILLKLPAMDRTDAVLQARRRGLGPKDARPADPHRTGRDRPR